MLYKNCPVENFIKSVEKPVENYVNLWKTMRISAWVSDAVCHLWNWHSKWAQTAECGIIKGWRECPPQVQIFILKTMQVQLSRDLMLGMLRKGQIGSQILAILDVIVSETSEVSDTQEVSEWLMGMAVPYKDSTLFTLLDDNYDSWTDAWYAP